MRELRSSWSLAADTQLLSCMQQFSQVGPPKVDYQSVAVYQNLVQVLISYNIIQIVM